MKSRYRFIAIVGQTASGKSGVAMKIASDFNGEIIAADSRTVYRGLSIGTAKPSWQDMQDIPHHLVDVADWDTPFNVADFQKQAKAAIADINSRDKLPILVGGSGLYADSVIYDYKLTSNKNNPGLRTELANKSVEDLQQQVVKMGLELPENALNKRYLIRLLERGKPTADRATMKSDVLVVGIRTDATVLEPRIRTRLQQMIDQGLLAEVKQAHIDYPEGSEALKGNIYRVLKPCIEEQKNLEECLEDIVRSDLKLAKRQYTWFKRNKSIHWFDTPSGAYDYIKEQLWAAKGSTLK